MAPSFNDILLAFEHVNLRGVGTTYDVRVCRQTGRIYIHSESELDQKYSDELPEDVEDEEKYAAMPDKRELQLGKSLALSFAREFLVDDYDDVRAIFSRSGAYAKFKVLLIRRGALERWQRFEEEATERALREWCKINRIELSD